ncbi:hypothetical protein RKE29_01040 [Streptomyces sp. B1866]|uniref:hypothetical protein n=1 Tax=Streptomyces sp. B1866 TaxID=3075431 RepID=UPI0028923DBF|nr:hypothetical protein [Streptomyces sp. B1866]MDT3395247.1 hypothetical protein [Streptomyces sp. B1866]
MTSIPLPDDQNGNSHWINATFDGLITDAEQELARQRRRVRQMRRQRRRETCQQMPLLVRAHSRAVLFGSGTTAFFTGLAFLCFGNHGVAIELFKVAVAAWTAGVALPARPQR